MFAAQQAGSSLTATMPAPPKEGVGAVLSMSHETLGECAKYIIEIESRLGIGVPTGNKDSGGGSGVVGLAWGVRSNLIEMRDRLGAILGVL